MSYLNGKKGVPVKINGKAKSLTAILEELNELGGKHGIGIVDIVENRVVGMKSRGVYETPGGTILMEAHRQLEELVLDRETLKYKRLVSVEFAELVYGAKWFSPLREALTAFVDKLKKLLAEQLNLDYIKVILLKKVLLHHIHYMMKISQALLLVIYMIIMMLKDSLLYMDFQTKVRAMKLNNKK